jgi:hypothetical protein
MNIQVIGAPYTLGTIHQPYPMGWAELTAQMIPHDADLSRLVYREVEVFTYHGVYLPCDVCLPRQLGVLSWT